MRTLRAARARWIEAIDLTPSTLRKTPKRRRSPPLLVRQLKTGAWEILQDQSPLPVYESREAALRATDLSENEKLHCGAMAATRDGRERVVLYRDVLAALAARTPK